ncbi:hypothetical protein SDC9_106857 [bioreactor metagenome]|uniref:Uncharacterized protein n=1 Tax=bioreactor metagenome TaxID=1076179 RepID=A0A645B3H3_9ZZZZ
MIFIGGAVSTSLCRRVGRAHGTHFDPRVLAGVRVGRDHRIGDVVPDLDGRAHRAAGPGAIEPVADTHHPVFQAIGRSH